MNNQGIHTSAMLVEFNVSLWTARKLDRKASDEVMTSKRHKPLVVYYAPQRRQRRDPV